MSDKYESVRSLSFPALAAALGLDLQRFKRRQQDWQGYCPIHQSKTNNGCFAYNDDGRFHCFSCEAKGRGAIDLTKLVKNLGFKEAVEFLDSVPPPTTKQEPVEAPVATAGVLQPLAKDTWRKFAVTCPWLEARIPDAGIRERYGVFCYQNPARKSAYSGRVMLPVKDISGQLFGYLGRYTGDTSHPSSSDADNSNADHPKYLFPKNLPKSQFLFGAYEIACGLWRNAPQRSIAGGAPSQYVEALPLKRIYLVESPFCVLKFAMYGLPALALFGWSVSEQQVELLATLARGVLFLPDKNKYQEAASNSSILLARLWCKMPPLPESIQDPEHLTKEQILALH